MTRHIPLQFDKPLFVKVPLRAARRDYSKGDELKWKELNLDESRIQVLYTQGFLYHNDDLEIERKVGDGLEALTIEELSSLVDRINKGLEAKSQSKSYYESKKCKKSKIKSKQIGLIRSWRRNYGDLED